MDNLGFVPKITFKKSLSGHTDNVRSIIFFESARKLVSCSFDRAVRIWNTETSESEHVLHSHEDSIRQVLKWNEEVFLSCGDDGQIYSYTFKKIKIPLSRIVKQEENGIVFWMSKVSTNTLVYVTSCDFFVCLDYQTGNELSRFSRSFKSHYLLKLVNSKAYENSVYINNGVSKVSSDESFCFEVGLVNWKDDGRISRNFGKDILEGFVNTMSVFSDKQQREILVCGGDDSVLRFFDTETAEITREILMSTQIVSTLVVSRGKSSFLFVGDWEIGLLSLINLKDYSRILDEENVHKRAIYGIVLTEYSYSKKEISIATCSYDGDIKLLEISNLPMEEDMETMDLNERVKYLLNYETDKELNCKFFFSIKLKCNHNLRLFKAFFWSNFNT